MAVTTEVGEPEYAIGERVKVQGWSRSDFGTVQDRRVMYHARLEQNVWSYKMAYERGGPGLSLVYVPEGYLRKLGGAD